MLPIHFVPEHKGNYAGLIMQITMSIIVGIPHYAHFFVIITNVRSKRKRKKLFGDKGLRKKFQKTRDIDICRQEDCFKEIKWERQSEKIFYVEKFFGKNTQKRYLDKGKSEVEQPNGCRVERV